MHTFTHACTRNPYTPRHTHTHTHAHVHIRLDIHAHTIHTHSCTHTVINAIKPAASANQILLKAFPLVFSLASFLIIAYYVLDHSNPANIERKDKWQVVTLSAQREQLNGKHGAGESQLLFAQSH